MRPLFALFIFMLASGVAGAEDSASVALVGLDGRKSVLTLSELDALPQVEISVKELGTIFPEFDDLARPIKRRINHAAVAALPISFRPALLAGVSRTIANPAILNAIRDDSILRGRRAFERLCETARLEAQAAKESHQM